MQRSPNRPVPTGRRTDPPSPEKLTPELVFREYAPGIYNLARRMLGNDADAEDATQDVLLQVVRKLDTFRGDARISTWLHRVTVNAALVHRQKRATRYKRETGGTLAREAAKQRTVAPDEPALAAEQHEMIEQAARQLAEPFRVVYQFADVEGLPNAEIGAMLHLSVPAVKSRLHRARLRMRHLLTPPAGGRHGPAQMKS